MAISPVENWIGSYEIGGILNEFQPPLCKSKEDLRNPAALATIKKLFLSFLTEKQITPGELVESPELVAELMADPANQRIIDLLARQQAEREFTREHPWLDSFWPLLYLLGKHNIHKRAIDQRKQEIRTLVASLMESEDN